MSKAALSLRKLDLARAAAAAAPLGGSLALSEMPRLAASWFVDPAGAAESGAGVGAETVAWEAELGLKPVRGALPQPLLHLRAQAMVRLQCQRCLGEMSTQLSVDRRFRFVADETQAEREDEDSDEEDVLALPTRHLDLIALLEDELILALPLVPRHERCPVPLALGAEPAQNRAQSSATPSEAKAHPFAALAALRSSKPSGQ